MTRGLAMQGDAGQPAGRRGLGTKGCGRLAVAALIGLAPAAASSPALAQQMQSVDFSLSYSKAASGKAARGARLTTAIRVWDTTGAKPPPLTHLTLTVPKGGVLNAKLFPRCNKRALELNGPSACPKGSKVGSGTAQADVRPLLPDPVPATITLLNGEPVDGNPTVLIHGQAALGPDVTVQLVAKKQRGGPYGYVLDVEIPPIPTLPGSPDASIISTRATTLDRTVRRRGRTPLHRGPPDLHRHLLRARRRPVHLREWHHLPG
ncbi:MAG: hypothetical protein WDZ37_03095 [Solirubrobacterales bacterium]